jgi:hypothetical protein
VTQVSSYGPGKRGCKKRREEVHSRRGTIPSDFGERGNTVNVSGKRLRRHSAQASTEAPDLGGDTGTSSNDNVEDETFQGQFELRRHQEAGSDDDNSDEVEDEDEEDEEEEEDVDAMDEDDDDQGRLKIIAPTYIYPDGPIKYHGAGMTTALKKLRDKNPYEEARTTSDPRFWAKFQQDYYATVIIKKPKITHKAQYVDWEHMARKNDSIFNEVICNCERQRVKMLMGFRQDWNKKIIAQFYATVHFGHIDTERAMTWMTNGHRYSITFPRFLRCFGIMEGDKDLRELHDEGELNKNALHLMYLRGELANYGRMKNLYTYYAALNRLLRVSITPRDRNPSKITKFQKNMMVALRPGAPKFSVRDFIWQEIKHLSEDPKKVCSYSLYIMYMIEKVAKMEFPKNVTHKHLKLNPSKNPRIPSPRAEQAPGREEEIFEEGTTPLPQQKGTQVVTGLTDTEHRSDRWGGWEHDRPRRSTSPLIKFLNFIFGMCRSQHDIQVEQQRSMRANKQMRDTRKLMHNAQGFQPPRSPPSPESPHVEIPSFKDRMRGWANSDMLNQYGPMFFESEQGQGSSSSAPPPPPPFAPPPPDVAGSLSHPILQGNRMHLTCAPG